MSKPAPQNQGIINHGTFNANVVAVGTNARATGDVGGDKTAADATAQLHQLLAQLSAASEAGAIPPELVGVGHAVQAELTKDKPNRLTIKSLLGTIGEGVGSVTHLVTAVSGLEQAIGHLF